MANKYYRTPGEYAAFQDMGTKVERSREQRQAYAERENVRLKQAIAQRIAEQKAAEAAGIKGIMTALGAVGGGLLGGPLGASMGSMGGAALAGGEEGAKKLYPSAIGWLPKREGLEPKPYSVPEPDLSAPKYPESTSSIGSALNALDFTEPTDAELSSAPAPAPSSGEPAPQSADYEKYLEEFMKNQRQKQMEEELPIFD